MANQDDNTVSVVDTTTHGVVNTIVVGSMGSNLFGVAVTPYGLHAYVANRNDNTASVIDTATHAVVNTIAVGSIPTSFGILWART